MQCTLQTQPLHLRACSDAGFYRRTGEDSVTIWGKPTRFHTHLNHIRGYSRRCALFSQTPMLGSLRMLQLRANAIKKENDYFTPTQNILSKIDSKSSRFSISNVFFNMKIRNTCIKFEGKSIGHHPRGQKQVKSKIVNKTVRLNRSSP